MSPETKRKLSKSMRASYRRRKAARGEQRALALFERKLNGAAAPEPTIRVSQMADFVVALIDAARRSK